MPKITVNGKEIEAATGSNLIEAARQAGAEIPHFCYHPGLSIAGNCRMCLIEIEKAPKLQIACNTTVSEGMVVLTDSDKVKKARQGVMEFLLLNHPIDCPICDCAGECYLQDYYMDHDLKSSRFQLGKNKKEKAREIGPHVMLDQERCIICSRCVRFTDEISKTHELGIFGRGSTEVLDLAPGQRLENAYSGCVVDLCPVGALTDKDFRFKSRPWFLQETETVCGGCAMGCNIVLNTNPNPYNKVGQERAYRIYPRENTDVNAWWICDEGRYSYKAIDHGRAEHVRVAGRNTLPESALDTLAAALKTVAPGKAGFLLSPQMSNEELWAWKWLANEMGIQALEFGDNIKATGSSDAYLIKADKNPNTQGAKDLGLASSSNLLIQAAAGALDLLIVAEHQHSNIAKLAGKVATLVGLYSQQSGGADSMGILLPRAHYAEQDGSFTNVQGRVQRFRKALEPLGESRPAWEWALALGRRLSLNAPASDAAGFFSHLSSEVAAYKGMTWDQLGRRGALSAAGAGV